ncbi:cyclic lactone autoinducer peptide [Lysinibacillus sp. OL1_EC]|nr:MULTISPECIES: cyclic lactone autoinducer peptide [unclassified Lysinibacillus]MCM0624894.1 cyclic lactone autoinducer peptide [Lysinibacillus sp. OL1_EC]MCS5502586.1 cyclic lactone autoinducer peptide [Lysinibacillus sp. A4]TBV87694.1 cyclic lactone autoinducer peptide [Lysinibacillus sp. OL1]UKJ45178.1 cyclic lactone autoinducer peptide [Lysinibacillus sp. ACHW1.5]WGT40296.1 cyclic lactone autoinducer peptide [Lysinibacillus sp. 1 U-2021]
MFELNAIKVTKEKLCLFFAILAISIGEMAINNCCLLGIYEPSLPEELKK